MDTEQTCHVCQSSNFFEENGNYWCMECNTMSQQITAVMVDQSGPVPAEVLEDLELADETGPEIRDSDKLLTTFELLTKVLRGLSLELIELGVSPELYKVAKILWLSYLQKCGLILNKHKQPVLPAMIRERDVEILYGVQGVSRKKIITGSSRRSKKVKTKSLSSRSDRKKQRDIMQQLMLEEEGNENTLQCIQEPWSDSSRNSSAYETDEEKIKDIKLVKGSENFIKRSRRAYAKQDFKSKLMKSVNAEGSIESLKMHIGAVDVLSVLWLAIQYTNSSHLQLSDLYRLATDGYLNLDNLERFVPKQYRNYQCFRYFFRNLSRKSFVLRCGSTCTVLGMTHIKTCDIRVLIRRYVKELALPEDILPYTDLICTLSSSPSSRLLPVDRFLPEYDLTAMAIILVTVKTLLGLDDATEIELSRVAKEINKAQPSSSQPQFDYSAWWEYIECRNASIAGVHNVTFENTYTRLMSHRLAARSFLAKGGVCKERTVKKNLLGGSKRMKSVIHSGLETLGKELEDNSTPDDLQAPLKPPLALRADEAYLPAWNQLILNQTADPELDPKVRKILETDFTRSSLDYLNPTKFSALCSQLDLPSELHEGRSPRSPIAPRVDMSVFLPRIPGNTVTPKVQAFLDRAPRTIKEEIDRVDEMLALCEIEKNIHSGEGSRAEDGKSGRKNKKSPKKKRKTKTSCENEQTLTLHIPKCQYWVIHHPNLLSLHGARYKYLYKNQRQLSRAVLTLCPVNFIALLNLCANIVRSQPYHVYASMCLLETILGKRSSVSAKTNQEKAKFWNMKLSSEKGDKDEDVTQEEDDDNEDGGFESM
uniref:TATA box-binding protein-associated factor RNA polymerase I subunit B n=3 Tax=Cacopsylla melanoneura TaxID=428564 RepID=A0A8D8UV69_9HEMI